MVIRIFEYNMNKVYMYAKANSLKLAVKKTLLVKYN